MEKTIKRHSALILIVVTLAAALLFAEIPVSFNGGVVAHAQTQNGTTGTNTSVGASAGANARPSQEPAKCNVLDGTIFINFFTCVGSSFSGFISGILVYISATFLDIAGKLFDWTLYYTVLQFGSIVNTQVMGAINTAWSAFRDIANIVIIAMFVFVAIQTILGSHEYGARKMIARLLIVAVLINFSLLFTKLIIDASNFTAIQFYAAANLPSGDVDGTQTGQGQTAGIAQAFENYAGVNGFTDTYNSVVTMARQPNSAFGQALLFGIFVALLFSAAAVVFLYGTFLLLSRAILLIFLMLTSSIAFATYLIPGASKGKFGWSKWWSSLLNSAVLAPLLIVLIWVSLLVGQYFKVSQGTLGDLVANPTSTVNIAALFGYMLVIGLLFVSFKVASSFSKEIGGFDFASIVPAYGAGLSGQLLGFLGRQSIGRLGYRTGAWMQEQSKDQTKSLRSRQLYDFGSQQFKTLAKQDFNAMRTGLGAAIQGSAGIKKLDDIAGKAAKGFEGTEKARAAGFAEQASRMKMSKDELAEAAKSARNEVLRADPEFAQRHAEASAVKDSAERIAKSAEEQETALKEAFTNSVKPLMERMEQLQHDAANNPGNADTQRQLEQVQRDIRSRQQEHQLELRRQSERITSARKIVETSGATLQHVEDQLDSAAVRRGMRPAHFRDEAGLAKEAAFNRFSNALGRAAGWSTEENDQLAKIAAKEVGEHHKKHSAKQAVEALREIAGHEEHADDHGGGHGDAAAAGGHAPEAHAGGDAHGGGDAHH